jgi:sugar lactone lactonase YvrE
MYIDDDQTIYVADHDNCRIMAWKSGATAGQIVAGGNGVGNQMNQLNGPIDVIIDKGGNNLIICEEDGRRVVRWPRQNGSTGQVIIADVDCCRLTMDKDGYLYVSDFEKHEVRRWKIGDTNGTLVAGGNRQGNGLNQLNFPTFIFVNEDNSIYVSERNNHRVMKWMKGAKQGIIVAGGQGEGNGLTQLSHPQGLIVDHLGTIYVTDRGNHRIRRWFKGALQGDVIVGGNGEGEQANQFNSPIGLSFDRQGNLYVADCLNHRIQRFDIGRS